MTLQMKYALRILILGIWISGVACTKAEPEFEALDPNSIPQPKFSGLTVKYLTTGSGALTFNISGECDPKIKSIAAAAVNGSATFSALDSVANSAPTVTCAANGTFSFQMKSLNALGFAPLVLGQTYEVQLKGMTSAGPSRASSIYILYSNGVGNPNIRVTGGGIHGGGANAGAATDGATYSVQSIRVSPVSLTVPGPGAIPTDGTTYSFRPAGMGR